MNIIESNTVKALSLSLCAATFFSLVPPVAALAGQKQVYVYKGAKGSMIEVGGNADCVRLYFCKGKSNVCKQVSVHDGLNIHGTTYLYTDRGEYQLSGPYIMTGEGDYKYSGPSPANKWNLHPLKDQCGQVCARQ